MTSLYDLINAQAIAVYWETLYDASIPYLGATLFPNQRMVGLKLDWIVGYNELPVALMPAAFDAKPVLRDRGGVESKSTQMPFFREAMRIGEMDRQQLLTLIAAGSGMTSTIVDRLFDDAGKLIDGAMLNPEIMRWSLLQTGTITMESPNDSGINVKYNYDYDSSGQWKARNLVTKTGTEIWTGTDANPIADILAVKRLASKRGVTVTRAVVSSGVWTDLLTNAGIGKDVFPLAVGPTALSDSDLQTYLMAKTGISFTVYDKMYKGLDKQDHSFMMDDRVVFLPGGSVGTTYFGTTPEEADLMVANSPANVQIVGGGVSVMTLLEPMPVNIVTSVAEVVLPSFEGMNSVYVLKVA